MVDSQDAQIGFQDVFVPQGRPEIDIIAVHGIGANRDSTWTFEHNICWLAHPTMLPHICPTARISTYGYASKWIGERSIATSLTSISQDFLLHLNLHRRDDPVRPVIFIGHCFGGLVIERMLLDSQNSPMVDLTKLVPSLAGVLLLGTPHRGSGSFHPAKSLAMALSLLGHSESGILEPLSPDSELLWQTVQGFSQLQRHTWHLYCAYENSKTDVSQVVSSLLPSKFEYVVNKNSACLPQATSFSIAADHFRMNKFRSSVDESYKLVGDAITCMVKSAQRNTSVMQDAIPAPKDDTFTGREALFDILDTAIMDGEHQTRLALCGPKGSGKTSAVCEWAHRRARNCHRDHIYWLLDGEDCKRWLLSLGARREVHSVDGSVEARLSAISLWLDSEASGRWIIIIDRLLRREEFPLLPSRRGTIVFIAGCYNDMHGIHMHEEIPMPGLSEEEGGKLLMRLSAVDPTEENNSAARRLVPLLDGLPLAIVHAAKYIKIKECTVVELVQVMEQLGAKEQDSVAYGILCEDLGDGASRNVMNSWKHAYSCIEQDSMHTAHFLAMLSVMGANTQTRSAQPALYETLTTSSSLHRRIPWKDILSTAQRHMITGTCGPERNRIVMPNLLALWIRTSMREVAVTWASIITPPLKAIVNEFPANGFQSLPVNQDLVARARQLESIIGDIGRFKDCPQQREISSYIFVLSYKLGAHYYLSSHFNEAARILRQCDPDSCTWSNHKNDNLVHFNRTLALALDCVGDKEGLDVINRTYDDCVEMFGRHGCETLNILIDKANMLLSSQYGEAIKCLKEVKQADKTTHSHSVSEDKQLRKVLVEKGLAEASLAMGDYRAALKRFEAIASHVAANNPMKVSLVLGQIEALRGMGQLDVATARMDELDGLSEQDSPRTPHDWIRIKCMLGCRDMERHQPGPAVERLQSALELSRRTMGENHPVTVFVLSQLAPALAMNFQFSDAETYINKVIDAKSTGNTSESALLHEQLKKADILIQAGRIGDAATLSKQLYKSRPKTMFKDPHWLDCEMLRCRTLSLTGSLDEAIKACNGAISRLGGKSKDWGACITFKRCLASTYLDTRKKEHALAAAAMLRELLKDSTSGDLSIVETRLELALALLASEEPRAARKNYDGAIRSLGTFHSDDDRRQVKLLCLQVEGKCLQAEGHLQQALECLQNALQMGREQLKNALQMGQKQLDIETHPDILQVRMGIALVKGQLAQETADSRESKQFRKDGVLEFEACAQGYNKAIGRPNCYAQSALLCAKELRETEPYELDHQTEHYQMHRSETAGYEMHPSTSLNFPLGRPPSPPTRYYRRGTH